MTEQVRRIVLVLHSHKPLVIGPVGGLDALRALVGLQADLVTESLPVVKGRIASASSRVYQTLTAESSQHHEPWPERQPSHPALRRPSTR